MRKQLLYIVSIAIIASVSCKTQKQKPSGIGKGLLPKKSAKEYILATDKCTIGWKGSKIIAGSHTGTINIANGTIWVYKGNIQAGTFAIDMHTIKNTDLDDEETKEKLVGHLSSPDFFSVDSFPTSYLVLTKVTYHALGVLGFNYTLSGNLTLKGITKEITFPALVNIKDNTLTATAKTKINRMNWNVKWGNKDDNDVRTMLKDNFISDMIELNINLVASAN